MRSQENAKNKENSWEGEEEEKKQRRGHTQWTAGKESERKCGREKKSVTAKQSRWFLYQSTKRGLPLVNILRLLVSVNG